MDTPHTVSRVRDHTPSTRSAPEEGELTESCKSRDNLDKNNNSDHFFSFGEISYIEKDPQFEPNRAHGATHEMSSCSILHNEHIQDSQPDQNLDIDAIISEGVHREPKGPPLDAKSQELVENWFNQDCDPEYIKKLKERYAEPETTDKLSGKEMNSEIYRNLPEYMRQRDFWLKSVQTNICTSAVANFRTLDLLLKNKHEIKPELLSALCKHVSSATKLVAKASSDLTVIRKQQIKYHIHPKYRPLCSKRTYDKQLFGENLGATLKETDECNKIVSNIRKDNKYHPYNPSQRSRPFLPQRGRGTYMHRGRGFFKNNYQPQQYQQQLFHNQKKGNKSKTLNQK